MNLTIKKFEQENYTSSILPSYSKCEHFWGYGGKVALLARNLFNAAAKHCVIANPALLKSAATHLKLLSIVSVPFALFSLEPLLRKIQTHMSIHDTEGMMLGSLSLVLNATDAFDSTSTFTNTALALTRNESLKTLSSLSLPIGFFLASAGTLYRTIQIAKNLKLYSQIKANDLDVNSIKKHLANFCGVQELSKEEIEKMQILLSKQLPKDALLETRKLFDLLESGKDNKQVFEVLQNIQLHIEKKLTIDTVGILANLIIIGALSLFSVGASSATPFLLMALAFLLRLISLIYQEQSIKPIGS